MLRYLSDLGSSPPVTHSHTHLMSRFLPSLQVFKVFKSFVQSLLERGTAVRMRFLVDRRFVGSCLFQLPPFNELTQRTVPPSHSGKCLAYCLIFATFHSMQKVKDMVGNLENTVMSFFTDKLNDLGRTISSKLGPIVSIVREIDDKIGTIMEIVSCQASFLLLNDNPLQSTWCFISAAHVSPIFVARRWTSLTILRLTALREFSKALRSYPGSYQAPLTSFLSSANLRAFSKP